MDTDTRTELLRTLAQQSEALRTSDGWQHWLNVAAKFRTYSLSNQLLIGAQRPDATHVAGYRTWQQLGRHVRKGEHGIRIVAPLIRRIDPDHASDQNSNRKANGDGERRAVISGFKIVHVFDIEQTEGDDLPAAPVLPVVTAGDDRLLDRLITAAEHAGVTVTTGDTDDRDVRGWYTRSTNRITLVGSYPRADQTRTMLHELAHAYDTTTDVQDIRAIRELVAESAAFIVGTGALGLDMTEASTLYVTSWGAFPALLETLANRVRNVARDVEDLVRSNADVSA